MTSTATLQSRGQITIPKDVREAIDIRPGDTVFCYVDGPSTIRLEVRPRLTWQEIVDRFSSVEPVDVDKLIREAEEEEADEFVRRLNQRMQEDVEASDINPLECFWEQFSVDGSPDPKKLREQAEGDAAEEAMGE